MSTGARKKVHKTEEEWQQTLSPEQYRIMRQKGTERAFTGKYHASKDEGVYRCAACGTALFSSTAKYDSGSGWPSFYAPLEGGNVREESDHSYGMRRTEVLCSVCDSHLGHLFADGPEPSGLRYCLNSAALELTKD